VYRPNRVLLGAALAGAGMLLVLGGCATMAGWVGIASEAQVEEVGQKASAAETRLAAAEAQLAAAEQALASANGEIDRLEAQLQGYQEQADRLEGLSGDLEQTIRTTRELEKLAEIMEDRLQQLPQDTLRLLADIIQKQLADRSPQ
jgi:peptidoglycan hydrolase CwlO-like protein